MYLTNGMKWFILFTIAALIWLILMGIGVSHSPAGKSDEQEAQQMCGNKGVAHFSYKYNENNNTEIPDITCK